MNRRQILLTGTAAGLLSACAATPEETSPAMTTASAAPAADAPALPTPPVAPKRPKRIEQLGRVRTDDYAWMKDDDWQKVLRDPKVLRADIREHLVAENAYTDALLASTKPLQDKLFEEMKARIKEVDATVPNPDGPWEYYVRYEAGAQQPIYARRPRPTSQTAVDGIRDNPAGPEQVLVDAEALSKGHKFYKVGQALHTPDHKLYAYAEDTQGSEYYTIRVKDLATGQLLPNPVSSAYEDFAFTPDSQWMFWTWRDENGRPSRIFRRPVRGGEDVLVYEEEDEGKFIGVSTTADDKYVVIGIGDQETSEYRVLPASNPTGTPKVAEPRKVGVKYDLDHWGDRWVILTNADGAVDNKLMVSTADIPAKGTWKELIPHQSGRFITAVRPYRDHLVRLERVNALDRIVVRERAGGAEHPVAFEEEVYALTLDSGYEYDTPTTRFVYQSPATPRQWVDYDMANRTRNLRKTQEIPSGHDPAKYVARRLTARASDGAEIPVTLLMKRHTPLDGSAPLLLYGYGSYGSSIDPAFDIKRLSLVDRGWIWAIAHVRGGSEKGWDWFLQGRKDKKINTFSDFIAAAEHLTANGYGRKGRIVAYGRSAGGLLMGAIANMRPDLWAGVIGGVPFVDALNTMSDTSLPLTPPEWPEWGNPLEDAAAYDYILSYSPYDQIAAKPYPAILATGGLSDPRVTYWEPAKWVARLRDNTTSSEPVLLHINMEAGHAGSAGRFDYLKEIALDYAFAIWAMDEGWKQPNYRPA